MKKRKVDPWFPFWIDKWLFGSTRIELAPDERGVFVDLMSLSKKDDGYIRANEGVPYLDTQLCGLLNITTELFHRTVEKCIKHGKTKRLKDGTLYMTSHEVYKLSERQERRVEKEMSEETDAMAEKEDVILDNIKRDNNKLNKEEKEILDLLSKVLNFPKNKERTIEYIRELRNEFPKVDVVESIKKKCAWWIKKPLKKDSNPYLQLRNWFIKGTEFIEEDERNRQVGSQQPIDPKKADKELLAQIDAEYDKKLAEVMKKEGWKTEAEVDLFKIPSRADFTKRRLKELE